MDKQEAKQHLFTNCEERQNKGKLKWHVACFYTFTKNFKKAKKKKLVLPS